MEEWLTWAAHLWSFEGGARKDKEGPDTSPNHNNYLRHLIFGYLPHLLHDVQGSNANVPGFPRLLFRHGTTSKPRNASTWLEHPILKDAKSTIFLFIGFPHHLVASKREPHEHSREATAAQGHSMQ